jgi:hypothetical protein
MKRTPVDAVVSNPPCQIGIDYGSVSDRVGLLRLNFGNAYSGSKDDLIRMGVRKEWFPGEPGANKTRQRIVLQPGKPAFFIRGTGNPYIPESADVISICKRKRGEYSVWHASPLLKAVRSEYRDHEYASADAAWALAAAAIQRTKARAGVTA